jgi:hypothetical protein
MRHVMKMAKSREGGREGGRERERRLYLCNKRHFPFRKSRNVMFFLAYFPYFQKIIGGLCDCIAVCVLS